MMQRENLDFVFAGPRARLAMLCVRLQSAAWEGIERERWVLTADLRRPARREEEKGEKLTVSLFSWR
jgi:hypothetical protein